MSTVDPIDLEVLRHLADGLTQNKIAQVMHMKATWVDKRKFQLYMKLNVKNAPQAVAYAIRNKLID